VGCSPFGGTMRLFTCCYCVVCCTGVMRQVLSTRPTAPIHSIALVAGPDPVARELAKLPGPGAYDVLRRKCTRTCPWAVVVTPCRFMDFPPVLHCSLSCRPLPCVHFARGVGAGGLVGSLVWTVPNCVTRRFVLCTTCVSGYVRAPWFDCALGGPQ
jgi:hypothetical protein